MDELTDGCAVCWVMGDSTLVVEDNFWASHGVRDCKLYVGLTGGQLARFRESIRYAADSHSCMKCGVSQVYCVTGQDIAEKCQWAFVLVPIVRAAVGVLEGIEVIREVGYAGELGGDFKEYAQWLGRRHGSRVWGHFFSNAMVVCIQIILRFTGSSRYAGS